jgi:hypothetical protein
VLSSLAFLEVRNPKSISLDKKKKIKVSAHLHSIWERNKSSPPLACRDCLNFLRKYRKGLLSLLPLKPAV